jgi:deoxyribodipyrimidine photolyase-related protein
MNFLKQNEDKLKHNPRLHYAYMNWRKMAPDKKEAIHNHAQEILSSLDSGRL